MDELKQRIQNLEGKLNNFVLVDKYEFSKLLKIMDGRNIVTGKTTGTKFPQASDQLWGAWGVTPVNQPETVADATDAADVILRLNDLIDRLQEVGIIK